MEKDSSRMEGPTPAPPAQSEPTGFSQLGQRQEDQFKTAILQQEVWRWTPVTNCIS